MPEVHSQWPGGAGVRVSEVEELTDDGTEGPCECGSEDTIDLVEGEQVITVCALCGSDQ